MIRVILYISGNVQHANYRSKVVCIAEKYNVKGNVQNLSNGNVKVIADGDEIDLGRKFDKANVLLSTLIVDNKTGNNEIKGGLNEINGGLNEIKGGLNEIKIGINNMTTIMLEQNTRMDKHNTRLEEILEKLVER